MPTEENNSNNYDMLNMSLHPTIDSDISKIGQSVYVSYDGEVGYYEDVDRNWWIRPVMWIDVTY